MLHWRLIIGTALVLALAAGCSIDQRLPGAFVGPVLLVLGGLSAGEMIRLARAVGAQPPPRTLVLATLLPVIGGLAPLALGKDSANPATLRPLEGVLAGIVAALALLFASQLRGRRDGGHALGDLAVSVFAVVYAGGLLGCLAALRQWGDPATGLTALATMVAIVKASDIGQYACGRLCGRRRLAPQLSPGKTWEGFAGGLLVAAGTATGLAWAGAFRGGDVLGLSENLVVASAGVALALAGVFGDLSESLLKRQAGVKDSSVWLPGFGGVLDLLDSVLFAGAGAYLLWAGGVLVR